MKIIGYLNYDYEHLPDPHLLTHINFSFAELYVRNGVYDHFELCGQNIEKLINVVKLKEINPELKVLISFTSQIHNKDNFQDGGFSVICNDEKQYKHLTKDIVDFIEKYNLDGVDLNWEWPGTTWSDQRPLPNDNENFNILVKYLRDKLPENKIITYASHVFPNIHNMDYKLKYYIEHINVMCYDMGEGIKKQAHNPIGNYNEKFLSCKKSIELYVHNKVISPEKYILGIPFYGRVSYSTEPKILTINDIKKFLEKEPQNYKEYLTTSTVPFLYEKERPICSFENEYSLYKKIKMVIENKLGGIMIWNVAQDTKDFYYLKMINNIIKNFKENEK